jgi:hypothetical protein
MSMGCNNRTRVSADYEIIQPQSVMMEPGKLSSSLFYRGEKVWNDVWSGSDKTCHEGVFVFTGLLPGTGGYYDYERSPQVFAIRGSGPPIMISERIFNQMLDGNMGYRAHTLTNNANGLRVEFSSKGDRTPTNFDVSWPQIYSWLKEAETSAPTQIVTGLGNYFILPPTNSTAY